MPSPVRRGSFVGTGCGDQPHREDMDISPPLQVHPVGHFTLVGDHHPHPLGIPTGWDLQIPPPFTTHYPGAEGTPARQSRVPAEEAVLHSSRAAPSKENPTSALVTLLSAGQRVYRLLLIRLIYSTQDKASRKKRKKRNKKERKEYGVCSLHQCKANTKRCGLDLRSP